jgi:uncharacterized protein YjiS (DUF1127 family)
MTDHLTNDVPISRSSRRLLQLSLITPRPCPPGGCICLTVPERRTLRRVSKIVRQWQRRQRDRAQLIARARANARA